MVLLTEGWKVDLLVFFIGVLSLFFVYVKRTYSYWDRKGFKSLSGFSYVFGHFKPTFTQQESLGDFVSRIYNNTKEPFIGIYSIFRPILLVRDPEIVRAILVKDFQYFTDRM